MSTVLDVIGVLALVLSAAVGCGRDDTCFVGDEGLEPEIEIVYRSVDGRVTDIVSGGEIPLIQPPQGGRVILVSARVRNFNRCNAQITARLIDPCNDVVIAAEVRTVTLIEDGSGGAVPYQPAELQNYANLLACPAVGAERDVEGEPYVIEISMIDANGRRASAELDVVPVCAEPELEDQCKCVCDEEQPCTPDIDGGPPPGTCSADAGPPDSGP